MVDFAEKCVGDGASFSKNHTAEHNEIQVAAMTANPSGIQLKSQPILRCTTAK